MPERKMRVAGARSPEQPERSELELPVASLATLAHELRTPLTSIPTSSSSSPSRRARSTRSNITSSRWSSAMHGGLPAPLRRSTSSAAKRAASSQARNQQLATSRHAGGDQTPRRLVVYCSNELSSVSPSW